MYQTKSAIMMDMMQVRTTRPATIAIVMAATTVMIRAVQMIKSTLKFCNGYSLGYSAKWNSLADETTTQAANPEPGTRRL